MAVNDSFAADSTGVLDGASFIVDGSTSGTGAVEIFELGGSEGAEIYREVDVDGDGTYEISVLVDAPNSEWHSQQNQLVVSQKTNTRIKITNISGANADYFAFGMEVSD